MVVYTVELLFAKWACDRLTEDADFGIIFSDQAYFDPGGYVNKQKLSDLGHRKPARIL